MARTRKLPTRDELRVWREFLETGEALRNLLGSRLLHDTGLSTADYAVLLALSEATGNRARSSDRAPLIDSEDRVVDDIDRDVGTAWGDQVLSFR